jgi:signal transduction histidine kinase
MRLPGAPDETAQLLLRKLRRDLHDDVGTALAAVATQLELALRTIGEDHTEAARLIERSRGETVAMIDKVRELVGPAGGSLLVRDQPDPVSRLRVALAELRVAFASDVELTVDVGPELAGVAEPIADDVFWIVHEAVVNVLRHAHATHCWVSVSVDDREVQVRVRDDGVGFPSGTVPGGTGLTTMRERAQDHGGSCTVRPALPSGALVEANMPI